MTTRRLLLGVSAAALVLGTACSPTRPATTVTVTTPAAPATSPTAAPATTAQTTAAQATAGSPTAGSASPSAAATTAGPAAPAGTPSVRTATMPPTSGGSADPFAGAVLTTDGYGPVKVGMTREQLISAGYGSAYDAGGSPGTACPGAKENAKLAGAGIFFVNSSQGVLQAIGTRSASVKTRSGAHVGMTVAELKALYGSDLTQTQSGFQAPETVWVIVSGNHSLMFFPESSGSSVIGSIYAVNQTSGGIDHGSDNC